MKIKKVSGKAIFDLSVIIISVSILMYFAFSENGLADLIKNSKQMDSEWIIMAFICNIINIIIDAYLICILTRCSIGNYKFRDAFKASMVGQFFSAITPFSTGGQPMQIYLMTKQKVEGGIASSVLIQKFLVYQSTLVAYSSVALFMLFNILGQSINGLMTSFAIFGYFSQAFIIFLLIMFSFNPNVTHKVITVTAKLFAKLHFITDINSKIDNLEQQLITFHQSNKELFKKKKLLVISYSVTAVQLTTIFIIPYCIYKAFHLHGVRPISMICSQAFVTMVTCFIPIPGAAGASEVSFLGFFSQYFSSETLKSAVLLWRCITYYAVVLFTLPFSRLTKDKLA